MVIKIKQSNIDKMKDCSWKFLNYFLFVGVVICLVGGIILCTFLLFHLVDNFDPQLLGIIGLICFVEIIGWVKFLDYLNKEYHFIEIVDDSQSKGD